jgi:hypothetical protein
MSTDAQMSLLLSLKWLATAADFEPPVIREGDARG